MNAYWCVWLMALLGVWCAFSPWLLGYELDTRAATNAAGVGAALMFFNLIYAWRAAEDGAEIPSQGSGWSWPRCPWIC